MQAILSCLHYTISFSLLQQVIISFWRVVLFSYKATLYHVFAVELSSGSIPRFSFSCVVLCQSLRIIGKFYHFYMAKFGDFFSFFPLDFFW